MTIIIRNTHPIITTSVNVREITKPLNKLGINFFGYKRCYRDGSRLYLTTNPDFMNYYFNIGYYSYAKTEKYPTDLKFRVALWDTVGQPAMYNDVRSRFDMDHGLYLIKPSEDYFELFSFAASSVNHSIVNTYFSIIDYLLGFTNHFCDQSKTLISQVNKSKFIVPVENYNLGSPYEKLSQNEARLSNSGLSSRQLECASYLLKGMSIQQIASAINLSPRTVEFYLVNLRKKLKCQNTPQLLVKLMAMTNGQ